VTVHSQVGLGEPGGSHRYTGRFLQGLLQHNGELEAAVEWDRDRQQARVALTGP
jgi:hypothetical protein